MKVLNDHKELLKQNNYSLGIYRTDIFTKHQIDILKKYGHWFDGLSTGKVEPYTQNQEKFIRVSRDVEEPSTIFEETWRDYLDQKIIEDIPHYNF